MDKKISLPIFIFSLFITFGCINKKGIDRWDNTHLDPGLPKELIYHEMDKKEEIYSFGANRDGAKRSSDVSYFSYGIHEKPDSSSAKINNCHANYANSDTLLITIGIGNGFSGYGMGIRYKNKKFSTEAYRYTDVVIEGEPQPKHVVIDQKLILNQVNYKVGDSLFGRVEFKSLEVEPSGDSIIHIGHGNFRAKVGRLTNVE